MTRRMLCAAMIAATVAAVATSVAGAVTPVTGGDVGGTTIPVNNGLGDQTEPRASGNLAVYTDRADIHSTGTIRYFDFSTSSDGVVPAGGPGDSDVLSDVNDGRIAFSRTRASDGATAVMLFDTTNSNLTELDPQGSGTIRFGAAIGGDTVAYAEFAFNPGEIYAYDLSAGTATNVSQAPEIDMNPAVAPAGDVVVWERCVGSNCDIYESLRSVGSWGAPTVVAATSANEANPDTDGTTVVYDSARPSPTGHDIYFRPIQGGPETALELSGLQQDPSISNGVIAFENRSSPENPADVWIYVLATNTVFRVSETPTVHDTLNDVTVLPSGDVRVAWVANDDLEPGLHNVYARTFTVPLTPGGGDTTPPTLTLPANITVDATSPAGAVVSYAASASDAVDPSPTVTCAPPSGSTFPIGTISVSCTATDASGNSANGSFNVTVVGAQGQLIDLVQEVVSASTLPRFWKNLLVGFAENFNPASPAQRQAACIGLRAFANYLQGVPGPQAAAWRADAIRIRAVLGCP